MLLRPFVIELFRKSSSYVSGVNVCIFVALWLRGFVGFVVWMCVAGANKVEGTMRYYTCKHDINCCA